MLRDGLKFKSKKKEMGRTIPKLRTHLGLRRTTSHAYYDHGQKSWDTSVFLGVFQVTQAQPLPSLHKQC